MASKIRSCVFIAIILGGCASPDERAQEIFGSNQSSLVNVGESPIDEIYFDHNQSSLRKDALAHLLEVTNTLNNYPATELEVAGTRSVKESNLGIGMARAISVKDRLVELGISEKRVRVKDLGVGANEKCLTEGSSACYERNQRVIFRAISK